jgi:Zn-dependent protease
LQLGALACPQCHVLLHGRELDRLAREARALEEKREFAQAREIWSRSLTLLPPDSKQAEWMLERLRSLEISAAQLPDPNAKPSHTWARRFGPLAPILILLAKSKGLLLAIFKLKFLLSFFSFIAIYVAIFGWRYGVGISVCLLIHEMGHYIDIKRRGLPAEMPVFLPGLGAYVRWKSLGVTRRQIAQISLAGPLAGLLAAAACYVLFIHTHDPLWAALARTGAVLNLLNLIPVWVLDGGQASNSLGLIGRIGLLVAVLVLWIYTGEGIFFLVCAGIGWRLYTKDKPAQEDWNAWIYYVVLLTALGYILHLIPANGLKP